MNTFLMILQVGIGLPIILVLIYMAGKIAQGKMENLNTKRFIKIFEKTQITKDSSIVLMKMGKDINIVSVTNKEINIIKTLSEEEVEEYQKIKDDIKKEDTEKIENLKQKFKMKFKGKQGTESSDNAEK